MLMGTETGLFASDDAASSWRHVPSPLDGRVVWSLCRHPADPGILFAGTAPAGVFRSRDGGASWMELPGRMPERCVNGAPLTPRVTCIAVDPVDATVFAGVEIAGIRRSRDGGESWEEFHEGLSSEDIHGLAIVRDGARVLLATTNNDVNRSEDDGRTWQPLGAGRTWPWSYTRACAVELQDPRCVWVGAGNGPPGDQGGLFRTRDLGETWERLPLPQVTNSTVWNLAFHPADPRLAFAASVSGQLYRSYTGGAAWEKMPREFGEIRALAWSPGDGAGT